MGTMLAQKKPLESIQRSQAINFVAEIFYDELQFILDRRLLDHTMVNCHGMNSRVKSRDVLSVSEQHVATANAGKEYILLNLARNSIYHQLPELLFHPLVLRQSPSRSPLKKSLSAAQLLTTVGRRNKSAYIGKS